MTVKRLVETATRGTSALVQRTSTQSASGNPTAVSFTAADIFDPDGWHDPSGSFPTRLTCPAGFGGQTFFVWGTIEWNPTGIMYLIRKNGTEVLALAYAQNYDDNVSAMTTLADTDYVELLVGSSSGGSILTDGPTRFGVMNAGGAPTASVGAIPDVVRASALIQASRSFR